MNIKKLTAIILMASIGGFAFGQSTEETINGILLAFYENNQLRGGASLAISRNGRLVYVGSVGYADSKNTVRLTPEHRMRIASLSKQITSIAIMKLLEERKISLDDLVFGRNGIFNNEYSMPIYRGNPVDITIRQLLEHTSGGWNTNSVRFGRFNNIAEVLRSFPLDNSPGTRYEYSNFGYHVLGRVIERKSGMTYENYVKENILRPAGISGMRIGTNVSGRDEAEYIAGDDRNPYTADIPDRMDASGGWVASPVELLKLLVRVDGFSTVPDILNSGTINIMTTPSTVNNRYALGWRLNASGNNWFHTGSLVGSSSMMGRASNGFNWVILMNYSPPASQQGFSNALDDLFWSIHRTVRQWPTGSEL